MAEKEHNTTVESNTESKKVNSALTKAISKNTQILAAFAIACTLAVSLVSELTKDRIIKQEQQQLLRTLDSIIAPNRYDNDITNDCIKINAPELGSEKTNTLYIAKKADDVVAVAITSTAPKGYNGNIDFIMAINSDGTVSGVRVLKHQETPGLGDKVEVRKSDWVTRFSGKQMLSENDSRWAVKKDGGMFDQFTGATITPRALVTGVKSTLTYFNQHKDELLASSNTCNKGPVNAKPVEQLSEPETKSEPMIPSDKPVKEIIPQASTQVLQPAALSTNEAENEQ